MWAAGCLGSQAPFGSPRHPIFLRLMFWHAPHIPKHSKNPGVVKEPRSLAALLEVSGCQLWLLWERERRRDGSLHVLHWLSPLPEAREGRAPPPQFWILALFCSGAWTWKARQVHGFQDSGRADRKLGSKLQLLLPINEAGPH